MDGSSRAAHSTICDSAPASLTPTSRRSSLRSRDLAVLVRKDIAELFTSRAYWLLLVVIGLLTGQAFIQAVNAYAEASGAGGGAAALPQALTPLDGILVPTLG